MKKALILIAFSFPICESHSQIMWQFNKDTVITWYYQEGDEFEGSSVNTDYWKYIGSVRSIFTNKEQQYYTDGENHLLKDGSLYLSATKKNVVKKLIDWNAENDSVFQEQKFYGINKRKFNYTAGYLETIQPLLYGYFEIKFKNPSTKGFWPAFWLYGGTPGEEIDIMELKTEKKNQIHVGRHSTKKEENYLRYRLRKRVWGDWVKFKGDLSSDFNVVSGEWTEDYVRFYLNGECIAHTNVHLDKPKKLIINIAVPSNGPFKPGPHDTVNFSGNFETDYIRVWSKDPRQGLKTGNVLHISGTEIKEKKLANSRLKSRDKFIYGTKKDHLNDGMSVSFFRISKTIFQWTVLGPLIPENAFYKIKDKQGNLLLSGKLLYGETNVDLGNFNDSEYTAEVEVKGQKRSYKFKI